MLNCTPFVAAIFSYAWFKEKLSFNQWIGLLIGFVGVVPLVILKTKPEAHLTEFLYSIGLSLRFLGVLCAIPMV